MKSSKHIKKKKVISVLQFPRLEVSLHFCIASPCGDLRNESEKKL